MSFLLEEVKEESKVENSLWAEKYRPIKLENYIGNDHLKQTMESFISRKDVPHLLFYGTAGTGKTTLAKLLAKNIESDLMYINASDENSVDNVRTKIKGFASTTGFTNLKIIILDEADFLSPEAQAALRNMMETFSLTTRFILTCNYQEKIIPALVSRCQTYQINPISKREVALHLKTIFEKESIKFVPTDIGYIVNTYYPDIRKILNFSQQSVLNGEIKLNVHDALGTDTKNKIIELLKSSTNTLTTFTEIRQLVADAEIRVFEEYYTLLYDKSAEYSNGKEIMVIITIAEFLHQSSFVVDKEITFMACIASILKSIK